MAAVSSGPAAPAGRTAAPLAWSLPGVLPRTRPPSWKAPATGGERVAGVEGELDGEGRAGRGGGGGAVAVGAGGWGRGVPLVEGTAGIEHRGVAGDVDLDQFGRILAGVGVIADHDGQRLADVADRVAGEYRLQEGAEGGAGDGEPDRDDVRAGKVTSGDAGGEAGALPGRGDVQLADAALGGRGPDDPRPQLAGGADVVAEPAAPAQQAGVFQAGPPGAASPHGCCPGCPPVFFPGFRLALSVGTMAPQMPCSQPSWVPV